MDTKIKYTDAKVKSYSLNAYEKYLWKYLLTSHGVWQLGERTNTTGARMSSILIEIWRTLSRLIISFALLLSSF